jgi:hypothetical protein
VLVRNALFRRVELLARRRWEELADLDAEAGGGLSAREWRDAGEGYFAEYDAVGTGPDAHGPDLFLVAEEDARWVVDQVVDDPAGDHDWRITAEVDLPASDAAGELALTVTAFGPAS